MRSVAGKAFYFGKHDVKEIEYEYFLKPRIFTWFSGPRENEGKKGNDDDSSAAGIAAVSQAAPSVEGNKAKCVTNTPALHLAH